MELTKEFSITRFLVHRANGERESVDAMKQETEDGVIIFYHQHEDVWTLTSRHVLGEGEVPRLEWLGMKEHSTAYVQRHIEKIESKYTHDYVAVAEVPTIEEERGIIRKRKVEEPDWDHEPEPDIWEKFEWEAHLDQR